MRLMGIWFSSLAKAFDVGGAGVFPAGPLGIHRHPQRRRLHHIQQHNQLALGVVLQGADEVIQLVQQARLSGFCA